MSTNESHSRSPGGDAPNGATAGTSSNPGAGPSRPNDKERTKRKKAQRACINCQRAHLTCSNQRPCERCTKRGLQNSCADGQRKKAKYLNDDENVNPTKSMLERRGQQLPQPKDPRPPQQIGTQVQQHNPQSQMQYDLDPSIVPGSSLSNAIGSSQGLQQQSGLYGDPSGTGSGWLYGLANFNTAGDLEQFNSDYAHTEDKAMHQITLYGAGGGIGTPDNTLTSYSPNQGFLQYPNNSGSDMLIDAWPPHSRSNSAGGNIGGVPHAFTIAAGPGSIATPSPPAASPQSGQPQSGRAYDTLSSSPRTTNGPFYRQSHTDAQTRQTSLQHYQQNQSQRPHHSQHLQSHFQPQNHPYHQTRRRGPPVDPSSVYTSVTRPYSYVQAYHRLFSTIEKRLSKAKKLRIAAAFASFRPSFIASAQSLRTADLIFQEQSCQRAIYGYESLLPSIGTPTLICRRSGEVVVVGKEFCMLSGWPKEVLLGEKPNLNTNVPNPGQDEGSTQKRQWLKDKFGNAEGSESYPDAENPTSAGTRTGSEPRPVFLLELLDDESVCQFYEDFAKFAFADATGKATRKCKILKYKPGPIASAQRSEDADDGENINGEDAQQANGKNKRPSKPAQSSPSDILGSSTMIDCVMCWTLRRDVFDIPMLIVLNFLPNLLQSSPNQNPASSGARESESHHRRHGGSGGGGSNVGTSSSHEKVGPISPAMAKTNGVEVR